VPFRFAQPEWLWLLVPVVPFLLWAGRRSLARLAAWRRTAALAVRLACAIALIFAIAGIEWLDRAHEVTVVFALDRSASIPGGAAGSERAVEYVREALETKRNDDRAGLVVFARGAGVEISPRADIGGLPASFHTVLARDDTDLAGALRMAAALFPEASRRRVVLLSDGVETTGGALEAARSLAGQNVHVDVLPIEYEGAGEVLVERLVVPPLTRRGESAEVWAVLRSHGPARARYHVFVDGRRLTAEEGRPVALGRGRTPLRFFLPEALEPGDHTIELRLEAPPGADTREENNRAFAFTRVKGESRALLLCQEGETGARDVEVLREKLAGQSIETAVRPAGNLPASLAAFNAYDSVWLVNLPRASLTDGQMEMIHEAVFHHGVGLVMVGGPDAFGAGGYKDTPVEKALPVEMDIKQRKVMPNGALVLILHTCEMPRPNFWGKQIARAAIGVLADQDYVGLLLLGAGGYKWLFPLQLAANRAKLYGAIAGASPGDMPDFGTTMQMALTGLGKVQASKKHVIIISDGDPSPPSPALIGAYKKARVTISTVAIAPHTPYMPPTMKNIAQATGGRYYFANSPNLLPQIFIKEAATVRRGLVNEIAFTPQVGHETEIVRFLRRESTAAPPLKGYVVTTPKPRAEVSLVAPVQGERDPVLAQWQYGKGRAVAFTSDATSRWAPGWLGWPGYGKFWGQVARWVARKGASEDLSVFVDVAEGEGRVVVDAVDAKGRFVNLLDLEGAVTDPELKGAPVRIAQVAPGRYEGTFPATKAGAYVLGVSYRGEDGRTHHATTGCSVNYAPEFTRFRSERALLEEIAEVTGGRVLAWDARGDAIFARDLPASFTPRPQWLLLLLAMTFAFPVDVFLRRVMLDWARIGAWCREKLAYLAPWTRRRGEEKADATLAALLGEKERLRAEAPPPADEGARARFLDALTKAREEAEVDLDVGRAPAPTTTAAGPKAAGAKKPREKPRGVSAYADKLLDAKRRALKGRGDQDKKPE